jgi:hypothetical protein
VTSHARTPAASRPTRVGHEILGLRTASAYGVTASRGPR